MSGGIFSPQWRAGNVKPRCRNSLNSLPKGAEKKFKLEVEFSITESGLEDAFDEYDELTVEGLLRELLDKSVACDDIGVKVVAGPNTLEEYDEASS